MGGGLTSSQVGTLPPTFYERPVLTVARALLGSVVVCGPVSLRLTEVEAYDGSGDPGSHAFRGPTRRNEVMFGPAGHAYVYFTYGMHWCVNVVCGPVGQASAVLLRAGAVVAGLEVVESRRPGVRERDLARGPARLTRALAVDGAFGGVDVTDPAAPLSVRAGARVPAARVRTGPRVGLSAAGDRPWRFWIDGERSVSTYRPAVPRRTRSPAGPAG